ncbi:MAG TPA: kelch repeat-containing protein [bacterium]|nr:kelch repeat-containing protein [bacterium]HPG46996.1 kelch repeat-containing protein [bacterium]HPM99236.1 kelch repeat-containing protein [bacterium]
MRQIGYTFLGLLLVFGAGIAQPADDWTLKSPASNPGATSLHGLCYIGGDCVLFFGGSTSAGVIDATWVYDLSANSWSNRNPDPKPGARNAHALAYVGSDQAVLFGGLNSGGVGLDDTFEYDYGSNTWTAIPAATKPSARSATAMAYIGGSKALLYGGLVGTNRNDETWLYDAAANSWTQLNPIAKPPALIWHDLAYIGDDQVLLFGGNSSSGHSDQTWLFDLSANTWTQKAFGSHPTPRISHKMAYIGDDQVLLFGGNDGTLDDETWVYDLSANLWVQDPNAVKPAARKELGLAETSLDGSRYLVLFGGMTATDYNQETWTFGGGDYSLPVELESFVAQAGDGKILLTWRTQSEIDCAGYHIYRGTAKDGDRQRLNSQLIPAAGTSTEPRDYSFIDRRVTNGLTYFYFLQDQDYNGLTVWHGPVEATPMATPNTQIPESFAMHPNFPNPFNPGTWLSYDLPTESEVELAVYSLLGTRVRLLVQGVQSADSHRIYWNGLDDRGAELPTGVYLVQLKTPTERQMQRVTLIK